MKATLGWPVDARPAIKTAGRFPHVDRGHEVRYCSPSHALHLYDYPCEMRLGKRRIAVEPGDLTVTPAQVPTTYDLPRSGSHLCIHFWPAADATAATAKLPLVQRLGPGRDAIARMFMTVAELHRRAAEEPLLEAAASATLQGLLLRLAGERSSAPAVSEDATRAIRLAAELLAADLAQPLDVPALARRVGMSQNYLARRFRERYGVTMQRYLLRARIEHAQLLLTDTTLPIKDIATRVGLPDPQHFNKQFRRVAGASPSAMRAAGHR